MIKLTYIEVDENEVSLRTTTITQLLAHSAIAPDPVTQVALARVLLNQCVAQAPENPILQGQLLAEILFAASAMGFSGGSQTYEVAKKH